MDSVFLARYWLLLPSKEYESDSYKRLFSREKHTIASELLENREEISPRYYKRSSG